MGRADEDWPVFWCSLLGPLLTHELLTMCSVGVPAFGQHLDGDRAANGATELVELADHIDLAKQFLGKNGVADNAKSHHARL
jgi:hypothetical protein